MNTRIFKIVLVLALAFNFSCKNESKLPEFKFADQPETVTCTTYDDLLKEALYSFHNDIVNKYDAKGQNKLKAFRSFISATNTNRLDIENIVTAHSKKIFDALKSKSGFFNGNTLNYDSDLAKCLGTNIKDVGLRTTYNALVQTNSMSPKLFGAPLSTNTSYSRDTYLATYIALDFFYAKLNDVDFTKVNFEANEPKEQPIDFNQKPAITPAPNPNANKEIDHTGHNHD